jgi:hypothetical protein
LAAVRGSWSAVSGRSHFCIHGCPLLLLVLLLFVLLLLLQYAV